MSKGLVMTYDYTGDIIVWLGPSVWQFVTGFCIGSGQFGYLYRVVNL